MMNKIGTKYENENEKNIDKEWTKFYLKNKNTLLYFYTDSKGEPEGYEIKFNNI